MFSCKNELGIVNVNVMFKEKGFPNQFKNFKTKIKPMHNID